MKHLLLVPLAALVLTGCVTSAPTARESVEAALDRDGDTFVYRNQTNAFKTLRAYGDSVAAALLRSQYPAAEREKLAGIVNMVLLGIDQAGLDGEIASGASSKALPGDGKAVRFRNRMFFYRGAGTDGTLWRLFGDKNRDLAPDLAAIPADALLAADFSFYPLEVAELAVKLNSAANGALGDTKLDEIRPVLEGLGGEWGVLLFPLPPTEPSQLPGVGFVLMAPDRDNRLFNMLAELTGNKNKDEINLGFAAAKLKEVPVLVKLENMLVLYSSRRAAERYAEERPRLVDLPEYKELAAGLPTSGSGFLYSSAGLGGFLARQLADGSPAQLPLELPNQLYMMNVGPHGIGVTGNSSWDLPTYEFAGSLLPLAIAGVARSRELAADTEAERKVRTERRNREFENCIKQLEKIDRALRLYAESHQGKFPVENDVEGLRTLLKDGKITPADLICPAAAGDEPAENAEKFSADNTSYLYFGGLSLESAPMLPLVVDWPLNHDNRFNVLFVNGQIKSFELENLKSCRRLVSFLHSEYKYSEADFRRLLDLADRVDRQYLGD